AGEVLPVLVRAHPGATVPSPSNLQVLSQESSPNFGQIAVSISSVKIEQATASIVPVATTISGQGAFEVGISNDLAPYRIHTVIVHIAARDTNVATIDSSHITLTAGLANATIVSIQPEVGGYAV